MTNYKTQHPECVDTHSETFRTLLRHGAEVEQNILTWSILNIFVSETAAPRRH